MKFSELHRRLERAGWYIVKETDHRYYGHIDFPHLIKIGRHGSKEVPSNEFNKVLKAAGLNKLYNMEIKKVNAIIGRSNTGFTIMMEGFDLAMSYGDTLEEAKRDFEKFPQEYIEISKEAGKAIPTELNNGNLEFEYVYDFSGFIAQKLEHERPKTHLTQVFAQ